MPLAFRQRMSKPTWTPSSSRPAFVDGDSGPDELEPSVRPRDWPTRPLWAVPHGTRRTSDRLCETVGVSGHGSGPVRVERTFAFVDFCGFTDFSEERGDREASDVLHVLHSTLREAASNHGVRVDKWLGDGAMLVAT